MRNFGYSRPLEVAEAIGIEQRQADTKYLGGGTNLVDLMKMGVEHPSHLVDITRLPLTQIEERNGGVSIGALVRNSEVAAHPAIRQRYPVLSQAILAGASAQIRNMATTGGNLLQRTRCCYFYDPSYAECNKRTPGSGCAAIQGYSRMHAILGASDHCIATYPGDMAVALTALEASLVVRGVQGERSVPIEHFYRLPGDSPHIENELKPGELVIAVELPHGNRQPPLFLSEDTRPSIVRLRTGLGSRGARYRARQSYPRGANRFGQRGAQALESERRGKHFARSTCKRADVSPGRAAYGSRRAAPAQ